MQFNVSAGSVKSKIKKGHRFCFVAPSPPSSCFHGHVTGLLSVYMLKYLLHQYMHWSIVNNLNQKKSDNRRSRVVLNFRCFESNLLKELGVYNDGQTLRYFLLHPRKFNATSQFSWRKKHLHRISSRSGYGKLY